MEEKGLYQSVSIDRVGALQFTLDRFLPVFRKEVESTLNHNFPTWVSLTLSEEQAHVEGTKSIKQPIPTLIPANFKMYCSECKRIEAFKALWFQDVTNTLNLQRLGAPTARAINVPKGFQLFTLLYQCQSCMGDPECFLIRRHGLKISMHGRSPIESVSAPQFIPEVESKWYRESAIAMKFGRPLAAIFYLRVFIEQFARRVTEIKDRRTGDEILSEYNSTIPDPPRSSMPSLKEWYGKLSESIHSADEDEAMLVEAFEAVDRHFEFRRLYKMPETKPKGGATENATQAEESQ
jgi:hypothetical protein